MVCAKNAQQGGMSMRYRKGFLRGLWKIQCEFVCGQTPPRKRQAPISFVPVPAGGHSLSQGGIGDSLGLSFVS